MTFTNALLTTVFSSLRECQTNNTDCIRFPERALPKKKRQLKEQILCFLNRMGLVSLGELKPEVIGARLATVLEHSSAYDEAYASLADDSSRRLLVELVALRVLGQRRVKLSTNN